MSVLTIILLIIGLPSVVVAAYSTIRAYKLERELENCKSNYDTAAYALQANQEYMAELKEDYSRKKEELATIRERANRSTQARDSRIASLEEEKRAIENLCDKLKQRLYQITTEERMKKEKQELDFNTIDELLKE